ncbi:PepSY domain-containing protein [Nonomuraea sp. NPDC046802]|uniref:PepSY domain-containing protein n=1 Tax=Nonomuraea sp. NPDC046802 TaxID=3154919 RepID=UPI0033FA8E7C
MNRTIIGALVGATVLAGGCGPATRQAEELAAKPPSAIPKPNIIQTETPGGTPPGSPTGSPPGSPGQAGATQLRQAAQAALSAVPNSKIILIKSEAEGRRWEVRVVGEDGTEHQMDVESGKVVRGPSTEESDEAEKAKHRELVKAAKLDYSQAADKILAAVPGGRITELNLDNEQGKTVWEADVLTANGAKQEVAVDAVTGEVTRSSATTMSPPASPGTTESPGSTGSPGATESPSPT